MLILSLVIKIVFEQHFCFAGTSWFSSTNPSCGSDNILSLKEVHNSSRGFLEKDAMVVQAEISEVAKKL